MLTLVHGAVGATCGALLQRRWLAVTAALISHFAVDAVSHEEPLDRQGGWRHDILVVDALLLAPALLALCNRYGAFSPQLLGALVACLPDFEHVLAERGNPPVVHRSFPHARWPSRKVSVRGQFAVGAVAWLVLLYYRPVIYVKRGGL